MGEERLKVGRPRPQGGSRLNSMIGSLRPAPVCTACQCVGRSFTIVAEHPCVGLLAGAMTRLRRGWRPIRAHKRDTTLAAA